jgi:hypothetical protein
MTPTDKSLAMFRNLFLIIFLLPLFGYGQTDFNRQSIDSLISALDKDQTLILKVHDTASYEKEDGGENWDSLFIHREYYYKNGTLVKVIGWNIYGNWRNDQVVYYHDNKAVKFSKGESFKSQPNYGALDFDIYYNKDKDIDVVWLTPKPDNVLGVATDIYLQWAYSLQKKAK